MTWGVGILGVTFLGCLIWAFRRHSVRILGAMLLAALLIGVVLPPSVLSGRAPLPFALGAILILVGVGTPLVGGWNGKSLAAAVGAVGALALAAGLPLALSADLQLSGLESHVGPRPHPEVMFWYDPAFGSVRFAALHLAALLLAAVGAVMDVAMVVASSVAQVVRTGPRPAFRVRFRTGLRAGTNVLGPMIVALLLMFVGIDLASFVVEAGASPSLPDVLRLLNYESVAAEVSHVLSASAGLLLSVPLTALCAAVLLRAAESSRDAPASAAGSRRPGVAAELGIRVLAPLVILLAAAAVEQDFLRAWDSAQVQDDRSGGTRAQRAIARVAAVQPPLVLLVDPDRPSNPAREPLPDRVFPCAARVLTGENQGRLVVFVNRVQATPYVNVLLWQARDIDPDKPEVHRDLAYAYISRRWVELARDSISRALPELDHDARTHYIRGVLACWEGDVGEAERELKRALELDPSMTGAADALSRIR